MTTITKELLTKISAGEAVPGIHFGNAALREMARMLLAGIEQRPVEEVTAEDCPALIQYEVTDVTEAWARGHNACRAAMLNGEKEMTDNQYERDSVLRGLQQHDKMIESLEQALAVAHESRREFVNRNDLNKCGSRIECKGCQDDDAHAHMVD